MNPQRNGDPRFRLTYLPQAKEQLRQIARHGAQLGRMAELVAAARLIERRLQTDPRIFGESTGSYRHAKLDARHAAVGPIVVHYAVHQEQPEVIIGGFVDLL
jgi:hypothetical protein